MIKTYKKILNDKICKKLIKTQKKLKVNILNEIKRRMIKNREILKFDIVEKSMIYINEILHIMECYNIKQEDTDNDTFNDIIDSTHYQRDKSRVLTAKHSKHSMINLIFNLEEEVNIKYTSKYIKIIDKFIKICGSTINHKIIQQIFRILTGNYSLIWKNNESIKKMKKLKKKEIIHCKICLKEIKMDISKHLFMECAEIKRLNNNEEDLQIILIESYNGNLLEFERKAIYKLFKVKNIINMYTHMFIAVYACNLLSVDMFPHLESHFIIFFIAVSTIVLPYTSTFSFLQLFQFN